MEKLHVMVNVQYFLEHALPTKNTHTKKKTHTKKQQHYHNSELTYLSYLNEVDYIFESCSYVK